MFLIQVTNYCGDVLFVRSVNKWRSTIGFDVIIREKAKRFATIAAAQEAIDYFTSKPHHRKMQAKYPVTFKIVGALE